MCGSGEVGRCGGVGVGGVVRVKYPSHRSELQHRRIWRWPDALGQGIELSCNATMMLPDVCFA